MTANFLPPLALAVALALTGCAAPPSPPSAPPSPPSPPHSQAPLAPEAREADEALDPGPLAQAVAALARQRPGVADVWFIGAGLWASEQVFLRETTMAREVFDERLDSRGRSLILVNSPQTRDRLPAATRTGIAAALAAVGRRMHRGEDVLALFVTTHGSRDHRLVIDEGGGDGSDDRDELSPGWLRRALDWSGARFRVVILSACYSGGFVDALAGPDTLIVTAADADNPSFGCGDTERFTYFGDAYLHRGLRESGSLIDAFSIANPLIAMREAEKRYPPSNPRFVLGDAIAPKLRAIEARIRDADRGPWASRAMASAR